MSLIVGMIIGLVLGLTGAGGSAFAVPLLFLLLGLPPQQAIGLSLGAVAISAFVGSLTKLKRGSIQWLPACVYSTIGGLMAPLGILASRQIEPSLLMVCFCGLILIIAIRMWFQANQNPSQSAFVRASEDNKNIPNTAVCRLNNNQKFSIGLKCIIGVGSGAIVTGFLSGLFGIGGGFLIIPTLLFLTKIPIQQAIATSLVIITFISGSGFISFLLTGNEIDTHLLGLVAIGGVCGMISGVSISQYIAGPILQKTFAMLLLLVAVITLTLQL